ncbi:hypothetical protein [Mesorhizobium onobrychidis]|uniref:DUF1176 domain-containing protein n=1 Tax=Mesorhizobium onobrychidis TaxID=2775404 RepID=A0ABY5R2D1_9HYPH|nr:hypothetical protein [Mesorhizobium onobrychidis]UVC16437.1 hypothetical protein IHQ72_04460 [Mesorhizobium onobrychidis]
MAAQAEEISDAIVLYKNICIAANGDLTKAEQLTIANGFSIDSDDHGRKTFDRTRTGTLSAPFVMLKPAGSNGNESIDVCEIFGTTIRMAEFDNYARSQGLVEVPKEEIFGDLADQNYVRIYANKECQAAVDGSAACLFIWTIGDKPVDDKFSGVFRFGTHRPQAVNPL